MSSGGHCGIDKLIRLAASELCVEEARVSAGLRVMIGRERILGPLYPFEVNALAVRADMAAPSLFHYATLLWLTPGSVARQSVRPLVTQEMATLLEDMTVAALSNFWGPGGSALSFAFPSSIGRPADFDAAVRWLAGRMGTQVGSGYRPPRRRDGGVDVVAWRSFLDRRTGFPIVLAQCTIQAETFTKTTDIDLRLWASWLAMDVDPLSLLVIPGTIRRQGPDWQQLSTVVMVIDRLRLIELVGRSEFPVAPVWTEKTRELLAAELAIGDH